MVKFFLDKNYIVCVVCVAMWEYYNYKTKRELIFFFKSYFIIFLRDDVSDKKCPKLVSLKVLYIGTC